MTYGMAADLNRRIFRVWNSRGHVITLHVAIPDAEISSVRFSPLRWVVAERYIPQQRGSVAKRYSKNVRMANGMYHVPSDPNTVEHQP